MDVTLKTLDEITKEHVLKTLEAVKSRTAAAKSLGISIRTLRNYLTKYKLQDSKEVTELPTNKFKVKTLSFSKKPNRNIRDKDFECMRNLTPEERDYFESRGCIYPQNKS